MPKKLKEMLTIDREINVELVTAETALHGLGVIPEIVKIDVQGAEMEVLDFSGICMKRCVGTSPGSMKQSRCHTCQY
jgi:FkbM family methyltransferase